MKKISRQAEYAQRTRLELLALLGPKCALCKENRIDELEFDHINGRDYDPRKLSSSSRMARYKREAANGELRVLCGPCNRMVRKTHENGSHCRTNETPLRTMEFQEIVEVEI